MNRDYTANCAICNGPGDPECPCEGDRLKIAIDQAEKKWIESWIAKTREWVTNNAINTITTIYNKKKEVRKARHMDYLQNLPYWPLYQQHRGRPPLHPHLVADLQRRIADAELDLKRGIDADWKECVVRYPQVLNHFYGQLSVKFPRETEAPAPPGPLHPPQPPPAMVNQHVQQQLGQGLNRSSTAPPKKQRERRQSTKVENEDFDANILNEMANKLSNIQRANTASRTKTSTPAPPQAPTPGPGGLRRPGNKRRESKEYNLPEYGMPIPIRSGTAAPSMAGMAPPYAPHPPSWGQQSGFDMGAGGRY